MIPPGIPFKKGEEQKGQGGKERGRLRHGYREDGYRRDWRPCRVWNGYRITKWTGIVDIVDTVDTAPTTASPVSVRIGIRWEWGRECVCGGVFVPLDFEGLWTPVPAASATASTGRRRPARWRSVNNGRHHQHSGCRRRRLGAILDRPIRKWTRHTWRGQVLLRRDQDS